MKYYIIRSNLSEIGTIPQVQTFIDTYDRNSENSVYKINFKHLKKSLGFSPDLDGFLLHKDAKITDVLNCAMINPHFGLTCNKKVLNILTKFVIPDYKLYEIGLYRNNQIMTDINFYWMHTICSFSSILDFEKSDFVVTTLRGKKMREIEINSLENLTEEKKNLETLKHIRVKNAVFTEKMNFDIIRFGHFDIRLYFSERIKEIFIENKVSGVKFTPSFELMPPAVVTGKKRRNAS